MLCNYLSRPLSYTKDVDTDALDGQVLGKTELYLIILNNNNFSGKILIAANMLEEIKPYSLT